MPTVENPDDGVNTPPRSGHSAESDRIAELLAETECYAFAQCCTVDLASPDASATAEKEPPAAMAATTALLNRRWFR